MRSVTVRISAAEFSATMTAIAEWLNANRYRPTRYKYDHDEDAVFVTVDFPADVAAKAFAMRFEGVDRFPLQPASLDSRRQLPAWAVCHHRETSAMRASLLMTSLRVLTWCCVILLTILSLLPDQQMVRTGLPGRVEHFVAYAGSAAIAMAGYDANRGGMQIIGGFWVYAGIL